MKDVIEGHVVFGRFEKSETYNWCDSQTGEIKPLRSLKVLVGNGDDTVSRESLNLHPDAAIPQLKEKEFYGFPVTVRISKKQKITYTLRTDLAPFPAPRMA